MSAHGPSIRSTILQSPPNAADDQHQHGRVTLDAFQSAFAGYLARTVQFDQLRRVVVRCAAETRGIGQVIRKSCTAAFAARCLRKNEYLLLLADLARIPLGDEPAHSDADAAASRPVEAGDVLNDRFKIQSRIADGGIGVLYQAIDRHHRGTDDADADEKVVAIKMLSDSVRRCPDALRTLVCEAQNAQLLAHPNIRTVYELGRCGDEFFIAMEWLDGESLATRLDRTGSRAVPWPAAFKLLGGVAAGLAHAHERGVVHGDVKPGNVFVTVDRCVKLLDFGQVYTVDASGRPIGKRALSPSYASCEIHEGAEPDARDDVFAFAVMAYRVLTGARPFGWYTPPRAERAGIRVLRPAGLDATQWQMLQQGLAWRREDRPACMREFIAALLPKPSLRRTSGADSLNVAA